MASASSAQQTLQKQILGELRAVGAEIAKTEAALAAEFEEQLPDSAKATLRGECAFRQTRWLALTLCAATIDAIQKQLTAAASEREKLVVEHKGDDTQEEFLQHVTLIDKRMTALSTLLEGVKQVWHLPPEHGFRLRYGSDGIYIGAKDLTVSEVGGVLSVKLSPASHAPAEAPSRRRRSSSAEDEMLSQLASAEASTLRQRLAPPLAAADGAPAAEGQECVLDVFDALDAGALPPNGADEVTPGSLRLSLSHLRLVLGVDGFALRSERAGTPHVSVERLTLEIEVSLEATMAYRFGVWELPDAAVKFEIHSLTKTQTGIVRLPNKLLSWALHWVVPGLFKNALLGVVPLELGALLSLNSLSTTRARLSGERELHTPLELQFSSTLSCKGLPTSLLNASLGEHSTPEILRAFVERASKEEPAPLPKLTIQHVLSRMKEDLSALGSDWLGLNPCQIECLRAGQENAGMSPPRFRSLSTAREYAMRFVARRGRSSLGLAFERLQVFLRGESPFLPRALTTELASFTTLDDVPGIHSLRRTLCRHWQRLMEKQAVYAFIPVQALAAEHLGSATRDELRLGQLQVKLSEVDFLQVLASVVRVGSQPCLVRLHIDSIGVDMCVEDVYSMSVAYRRRLVLQKQAALIGEDRARRMTSSRRHRRASLRLARMFPESSLDDSSSPARKVSSTLSEMDDGSSPRSRGNSMALSVDGDSLQTFLTQLDALEEEERAVDSWLRWVPSMQRSVRSELQLAFAGHPRTGSVRVELRRARITTPSSGHSSVWPLNPAFWAPTDYYMGLFGRDNGAVDLFVGYPRAGSPLDPRARAGLDAALRAAAPLAMRPDLGALEVALAYRVLATDLRLAVVVDPRRLRERLEAAPSERSHQVAVVSVAPAGLSEHKVDGIAVTADISELARTVLTADSLSLEYCNDQLLQSILPVPTATAAPASSSAAGPSSTKSAAESAAVAGEGEEEQSFPLFASFLELPHSLLFHPSTQCQVHGILHGRFAGGTVSGEHPYHWHRSLLHLEESSAVSFEFQSEVQLFPKVAPRGYALDTWS
jgi:hypothetical protein